MKEQLHLALSNARFAASLMAAGGQVGAPVVLTDNFSGLPHGSVCLANDSLLRQTDRIEELTMFAASYDSMVGNRLTVLRDFLVPTRPTPTRQARLTTYDETEPWETVDYNRAKRGLMGDFAEVRQRKASKADFQIPNRGLSVVLDKDELKTQPEWQQVHTKWLIDLLTRATVLEAVDVFTAAAVANGMVWNVNTNPDLMVMNEVLAIANITGFYPQNAAYGDAAVLQRRLAYEPQFNAGALARAAAYTEAELAAAIGIPNVLINAERYQSSAAAKSEIIGQNLLLFTGIKDAGPMDPSNVVRHVVSGAFGGGDYAVYVTELGVKKFVLTVENYEYLHTQHTTGIEKIAIAAN